MNKQWLYDPPAVSRGWGRSASRSRRSSALSTGEGRSRNRDSWSSAFPSSTSGTADTARDGKTLWGRGPLRTGLTGPESVWRWKEGRRPELSGGRRWREQVRRSLTHPSWNVVILNYNILWYVSLQAHCHWVQPEGFVWSQNTERKHSKSKFFLFFFFFYLKVSFKAPFTSGIRLSISIMSPWLPARAAATSALSSSWRLGCLASSYNVHSSVIEVCKIQKAKF